MKSKLFVMMCFLLMIISAGCSNDDQSIGWLSETDIETASDPNSIIGIWELQTLCYPDFDTKMPVEQRDIFMFSSKGQVKVIKKTRSFFPDFPNEDGEYEYSYDNEKQIIQLCGVTRACIISNGEMRIESGYNDPDSEPVQFFIFIKRQI